MRAHKCKTAVHLFETQDYARLGPARTTTPPLRPPGGAGVAPIAPTPTSGRAGPALASVPLGKFVGTGGQGAAVCRQAMGMGDPLCVH